MSFHLQPLQDILIKPVRKIGPIAIQVIINENTTDTLTITKQPVQQGASITDHSFKEPTGFSITALFKDNVSKSLSAIYQDLLDLQNSRTPFDVVTPKRIYKNMLMATLSQTTDKSTENCLAISAAFQEVIIVSVSTTTVPRDAQAQPQVTAKTENSGPKSSVLTNITGIGQVGGVIGR